MWLWCSCRNSGCRNSGCRNSGRPPICLGDFYRRLLHVTAPPHRCRLLSTTALNPLCRLWSTSALKELKWSLWWQWYQFTSILSVPNCKYVANNINFNSTLTTWKQAARIKVFLIPKNDSTLVGTNRLIKDHSRQSGSILERSSTKLASGFQI